MTTTTSECNHQTMGENVHSYFALKHVLTKKSKKCVSAHKKIIVLSYRLFEPIIENYLNKGHIVATDNWYTSKEAFEFVRDTLGKLVTCKAHKKDIPRDVLLQKKEALVSR